MTSNLKVLFVDDDVLMRRIMELFLYGKVRAFLALGSAEEALEHLKAESFDVVISDYVLPGMSGLAFLEHVGRIRPESMRILVTGYGTREIEQEAEGIGVHAYLSKPFQGEQLKGILAQWEGVNR